MSFIVNQFLILDNILDILSFGFILTVNPVFYLQI